MVVCLVSGILSETVVFHRRLPAYLSPLGDIQPETNTGHKISKWFHFCNKWNISEVSPSLNYIIEFLTEMYEKGHSYSSINVARSSLSPLGLTIESRTAGSHPLVIRFLKGVFNTRPPQPRYSSIWDVNVSCHIYEH